MAHLCVWWTWLSPAVADRLVVHPVQVVPALVLPVQVVPVQVVPVQVPQPLRPKALVLQDHAQALRQASLVQPLRRTLPWLDRTLA
jgi:hypothetical protein